MLFTDRLIRRADIFAVTTAKFAAKGVANLLINPYIPLWECPRSICSDSGFQLRLKFWHVLDKFLRVPKIATTAYHLNGNSDVKCVSRTIAQLLARVVNERKYNCDVQFSHVEFSDNCLSTLPLS